MAARGLLENPALYAGYEKTPWGCVERYVDYALSYGSNSHIFQHHLAEMTRHILPKKGTYILHLTDSVHRELNELKGIVEIIDWLDERFILRRPGDPDFGTQVDIDRR
jgi:tRNA-dihydrouridine synthase 4